MTDLPFSIVDSLSEQELEFGRKLFAGPVDFLKGVVAIDGLPPDDRIEVCFAGRSNVGKSSLINALTGRNSLARTSSTPGRTQEINFFSLGTERYLVDLPGYGFAKAPKHIVEKWQRLLKAYLSGRASLRRAFVLVDARHGIKPPDSEIIALLNSSAVTFQVVLTKSDKPSKSELEKNISQVRKTLQKAPAAFPELLLTSSVTGKGMPELRATIAAIV